MPSISSFTADADLAMTNGKATGLCNQNGSESGCGVQGRDLGGMPITVQASDNTGPTWSGTLSGSANDGKSSWIANLTCSGGTGGGMGAVPGDLGDPIDVEVTVKVGADARSRITFTPPTKIKVGPAPTT
jgi:hypothetical protein